MYLKNEQRHAFTVVGMKARHRNEQNDIPALWESFVPRQGEISPRADQLVSYGVMDNCDQIGEFDYIACVEVDPLVDIPEGMVSHEIPEGTYAVFKGSLSTIQETFDYIYGEWLPVSGYRRAPGPEFELYNQDFERDQTIYTYIPVRVDE
jgi:AraC family transcriptional regulator